MNGQVDLLVDSGGLRVADNSSGIVGIGGLSNIRMIYSMSQSLRYYPSHSPGDSYDYGISFDDSLPKGIGVVSGTVAIFTNAAAPAPVTDLVSGPVTVQGRVIHANISGGTSGQDYQLRWMVTGSDGSIHERTGLLLCAQPS